MFCPRLEVEVPMLSPQDYWRAIVLYGANVATYKPALADCLIAFAQVGATNVLMLDLADAFFQRYRTRLAGGRPQLSNSTRKTVLERAVEACHTGRLTDSEAVEHVAREGFGDVLPRFHTVNTPLSPDLSSSI